VRARCQAPGRSATTGWVFGFAELPARFSAVFLVLFKTVS
jgi:hypothetical protein